MKKYLLILLCLSLPVLHGNAQEIVRLTLEEALSYSLENNVNVKNAKLETLISKATVKETTATGLTHDYDGKTLPYTLKQIEVDGIKIAEMVTVAMGMWGGEVRLLTIIKPIDLMSDFLPFESDPYASDYVIPWLDSQ